MDNISRNPFQQNPGNDSSIAVNALRAGRAMLAEAETYYADKKRGGFGAEFPLNRLREPIGTEYLGYQVVAALSCKFLAIELCSKIGLHDRAAELQRDFDAFYVKHG